MFALGHPMIMPETAGRGQLTSGENVPERFGNLLGRRPKGLWARSGREAQDHVGCACPHQAQRSLEGFTPLRRVCAADDLSCELETGRIPADGLE